MSKLLSGVSQFIRRRLFYGLISAMVAMSLILATPAISYAQSWLDLILRGIEIIQLANLSDRQEAQIGAQIDQQLMRQQFQLYRNESIADYVDDLGQSLVPFSDRSDIDYTFRVVESDQVNAFATMGGYVYVTTGLLRAAENEAQLAGVLGHEIGHIVERHVVDQMEERAIQQGILTAAGLESEEIVALGVEIAINRSNSRSDELEADVRGYENIVRAGYAPIALVNFLENLEGGGGVPQFLSTHPATSERIERLQAMMDPATASVGNGLNEQAYRSNIQSLL
ncbi:M48 family metallopeptidase [Vacuolonema iberomarrocanum]|uniref:M48 family metallopeptidase n=1 Tax=Vacuolonema iberomarrocanum TaxID=3454632 RepID=UPI0019FA64D2|nr:M48 family metalloprotease [filamentous cyanobacterium LEGE 07170]